jgi:hypothetical protein
MVRAPKGSDVLIDAVWPTQARGLIACLTLPEGHVEVESA